MRMTMSFLALLLLFAPSYSLDFIVDIKNKDIKNLKYECHPFDANGYYQFHTNAQLNTLQPGQQANFTADDLAVFDCTFIWQSKQQLVTTFDYNLQDYCTGPFHKNCNWEVRTDGFWFYHIKRHWIRLHGW